VQPQLASVWIGHWTGEGTGVTVLLPPPGTTGSGEVRGGAPATREFALLEPAKMMDRVDAVVLSGGSAFGLAAAGGVMKLLHERGTGFATPVGPVPIVVGMSLFDGVIGAGAPGPDQGAAAALAALSGEPLRSGAVGAGAGATSGKWRMKLFPGGFGWASRPVGEATLAAVAVVNSWGDVIASGGAPVFSDAQAMPMPMPVPEGLQPAPNTTLVVVITDALLSKLDCYLLAQSGHDGLARAIDPVHTRFDGDAVVTLATGAAGATAGGAGGDTDALRAATPHVVADAIRAATTQ
jgi:L-aminopeptidase/D-esterase-like protein